jgi:DNA-binding response OmpR family regulator
MPTPRVLVVDDDRFLNRSIEELFRKNGFAVDTAFDGSEAIRKIGPFDPHLIVLDVMMPGENGYRVSRLIKTLSRRRRPPRILLLTARSLEKEPEREDTMFSYSKADEVMYKPFEFKGLLETANRLLQQ